MDRYLRLSLNPGRMPGERLAEARITAKGQVTLPVKVQRVLGVTRGDYLLFYREGERIWIVGGTVRPKR